MHIFLYEEALENVGTVCFHWDSEIAQESQCIINTLISATIYC